MREQLLKSQTQYFVDQGPKRDTWFIGLKKQNLPWNTMIYSMGGTGGIPCRKMERHSHLFFSVSACLSVSLGPNSQKGFSLIEGNGKKAGSERNFLAWGPTKFLFFSLPLFHSPLL